MVISSIYPLTIQIVLALVQPICPIIGELNGLDQLLFWIVNKSSVMSFRLMHIDINILLHDENNPQMYIIDPVFFFFFCSKASFSIFICDFQNFKHCNHFLVFKKFSFWFWVILSFEK